VHQLVNKQNFDNNKIHGTNVKIAVFTSSHGVILNLRYIYFWVSEDFPPFIVPN